LFTGFIQVSVSRHKSSPAYDDDDEDDHEGVEGVEVNIEMRSNWGHKDLLGLTEIRFFDGNNHPVLVSTECVTVHGNLDNRGSIDSIFNGKTKVCHYIVTIITSM